MKYSMTKPFFICLYYLCNTLNLLFDRPTYLISNIPTQRLIPLFFCIALGAAGAFGYTMRLAFKNPDVSWNKKSNPEPNEEYANRQYKITLMQT
ncbi:Cytochrome c oxidase subunit NDUFA4 [Armadillidium nasatum]|uniref:Cytochrome c oxidase subunit NDUFA4 n=1 Tax=Armadillidium nasatum TaxID=96803 RepID=A0A5N5T4U8_9CRUS|nr:Cytochrome c oxidase subunit NDUFA4 [Armadillidium nasatum]